MGELLSPEAVSLTELSLVGELLSPEAVALSELALVGERHPVK